MPDPPGRQPPQAGTVRTDGVETGRRESRRGRLPEGLRRFRSGRGSGGARCRRIANRWAGRFGRLRGRRRVERCRRDRGVDDPWIGGLVRIRRVTSGSRSDHRSVFVVLVAPSYDSDERRQDEQDGEHAEVAACSRRAREIDAFIVAYERRG